MYTKSISGYKINQLGDCLMFSKKESFTAYINEYSHTHLFDDLAQDKAEIEKYNNKLLDGNLNIPFALKTLKKEETRYTAYIKFLIDKNTSETGLFKETTLPFIYQEDFSIPIPKDSRLDDIVERKWTAAISLKATKNGDFFKVSRCKTYSLGNNVLPFEDVFNESFWGKTTSGKFFVPSYIFNEFSYNDNASWFNKNHPIKSGFKQVYSFDKVWVKALEINYIREKLEIILNFYYHYIKELIDQLEITHPEDQINKEPTNPPDYKESSWYKAMKASKQSELEKILKNENGFKDYLDNLFALEFFYIDEKGNPKLNTEKIHIPDLRRLINKLVPQVFQGKFSSWEKFLNLGSRALDTCAQGPTSPIFTEICKELKLN